ncbi:MAG TPA: patatin-like phospholipase family protein [Usitatibacteraceae bacterium]|nr:patatin-like phospholipase family protein [Usitatibacteraceae bacterium]
MARLIRPQLVAADPHARKRATARSRPKIGLALAGGGPLGAIYEVGVLKALDEALTGIDLNDLDVYVGVSAGSFITAGLANQITPQQLFQLFIENKTTNKKTGALTPELFLRPAFREYWRRLRSVPPLLARGAWRYLTHPTSYSLAESFAGLARALPTGLFDNDVVRAYLQRAFSEPGRSDDFRTVRRKLYSIATDLDTGETVRFGGPGFEDVPISQAVQASSALPGLFPPVKIGDRYYVDGALKKTMHASVALEEGARLVLCINPIVPFNAAHARRHGRQEMEKLVEGGLPTVLSQTFRAIIHSRMQVGLQKYVSQYKGADVVLFEPSSDDAEMFFSNLFSYSQRRRVCEHAYQRTRADLLKRRFELEPVLARHGVGLDIEVLKDPARRLDDRSFRRSRGSRQDRLKRAQVELSDTVVDLERWLQRRKAA